MCGLTAYINPKEFGFVNADLELLKAQMFINSYRGLNSTGVVSVSKTGEVTWVKEVGPPFIMMNQKSWPEFEKVVYNTGQIVFTHARAATRGDVNVENAHPFSVEKPEGKGKIILMHNGTLDLWQQLPGLHEHDVDSEWLAKQVANLGPKEAFGKIRGPIACMWWDTEFSTFNIYRNDDRPLHVARNLATGEYYINSEVEALMWLRYKFDLPFKEEDCHYFKPEHHYSLKLGDWAQGWTNVDEIKTIDPPVYHNPHYQRHNIITLYDDDDDYATLLFGKPREPDPVVHHPWQDLPAERSWDVDCNLLMKGRILWVEFDKNERLEQRRKTALPKHGQLWTVNQAPYKKDLVRMELTDQGDMIFASFVAPEGHTYSQTFLPPRPKEEKKAAIQVKEKEACVPGPFLKGTKKKFKTIQKGKETKHKCVVSKSYERNFDEYWNADDGKFCVGDRVNVEMYEFTPRDEKRLEVRAIRLDTEGVDKHVDCYFIIKDIPQAELEQIQFMTGTIKLIRLCNKDEFEKRGNVVHLMLCDLEPSKNAYYDEKAANDSIAVITVEDQMKDKMKDDFPY